MKKNSIIEKNIIIVLLVLLVLAGGASYISYSAADSLVHWPHEKALSEKKN